MKDHIKVLRLIANQAKDFNAPLARHIFFKQNPYRVLISCILSLRTKDRITAKLADNLFKIADRPENMVKLSFRRLQKLVYPSGFYRNKAKTIIKISNQILRNFGGKVPGNLRDLLSLKGVGKKTANLVLGLCFGIPAICVDTHVHRISNRLGWIKTKNPAFSESALAKIFPEKFWVSLNGIFVKFGQNICLPVSPLCSKCNIFKYCRRTGVGKSR